MIQTFKGAGTEAIFNGDNTQAARRTCPESLWKVAQRKLDLLDSAASLQDLRIPPANHLERLTGQRKGQHSIRVNDQYRVCFIWRDGNAFEVEIVDYH